MATTLLLLGAAEGVARWVGGPPKPRLIAPIPERNGDYFTFTDEQAETLFQGDFSIGPFPAQPDSEQPRVIWLGGSSIRGGEGRIELEEEVPAQVAEALGVESLNLGAPGIDSHHLLQMTPSIIDLKPAIVVFYTGHNDRGNAVFFNNFGDLKSTLIARTRGVLGGLRLFQALEESIAQASPPRPPKPGPEGSTILTEAHSLEIEHQFEAQLRRSVRMLKEADIQVVLSTLISNPWAPPHFYGCPELMDALDLRPHPDAPVALHLLTREALEAQRANFEGCHEVPWLDGLLLHREGDLDASARALDLARDQDPMPLRANSRTQEIIRTIAREEEVTLIDAQAMISESGEGIEPTSLFSDIVHPSPAGHRALAAVMAPTLADLLGLPEPQVEHLFPVIRSRTGPASR